MDGTALKVHEFLSDLAGDGMIETHAARIYLLETEAWKVKRPVRYDYLDFRDLADRQRVLLRELDLNRKTAPTLYHDVVAITREADGHLAVAGSGEPVEWVLRMARFPADDELSVVAERGELGDGLARALGQSVHRLHAAAPVRNEDGAALIGEILDEFDREFRTLARKGADVGVTGTLTMLRSELDNRAELLRQRSVKGFVRRCHGDLHLGNIVLLDGVPTPFDALEFDERLGICDVLYDLAFLLMDLAQRGQLRAANAVLNAYLDCEDGPEARDGLAVLPLFAAVRAMVRAMVAAEHQSGLEPGVREFSEGHAYVDLAANMLRSRPLTLVAVGGLSGTGKTTVSRLLAPWLGPPFGAIHIRSDVVRKRLAGVDPLQPLDADAYTQAANSETYQTVMTLAEACLKAGQSVIVDAVFADVDQRRAVERLATALDVPFAGLWLVAPDENRSARVGARGADASDADQSVVAKQATLELGPMDWARVPTRGSPDETARRARAIARAITAQPVSTC